MTPDPASFDAVLTARRRTLARIDSLEATVATIVEGAELTSTDDEHDPEGATIAYERAQALSLLRSARGDLSMLDATIARLEAGDVITCGDCGRPIPVERLLAVPTTSVCVSCAS